MKFVMPILLTLAFASFSNAEGKSEKPMHADKMAVESACASDAAKAGCGSEKIGTGLLKCIHTYKKANKDFKISDGCKNATKKMRSDRHSMKK